MLRKFRAAVVAIGLVLLASPAMAFMHTTMGMDETGMYNLTVGGLAGRDDAKGVDEKFRDMADVDKVHVDFDNGMIMIWMNKDTMLDRGRAERIVKGAGFTLDDFEMPKK